MFLEVGERRSYCLFMGNDDPFVACHQCQDRYRFGGADIEVPTGMMLDTLLATTAKLLVTDLTGKKFLKLFGIYPPRETKVSRDAPAPFGWFIPTLRVIIAYRVVSTDIGGGAFEAARMDHAGFAFSRAPSARSWLASVTRTLPRDAPSRVTGVAVLCSLSGATPAAARSSSVSGLSGAAGTKAS